ncbi:hypothetical protein FHS10_005489 [Mucilaginibacter dorajii]|nr:hypothetical protein [Mucilaginibacter dorajii]
MKKQNIEFIKGKLLQLYFETYQILTIIYR